MRFADFVIINPKISLLKGNEYTFVAMDIVNPGNRYISSDNRRPYKGGGAKFQTGDTLFARITPCLENGKIVQFLGLPGEIGFGSTEFFIFRHRTGISDPGYVFYLAQSEIIRKPAEKSMSGASGRQRADVATIENIEITPPPLPTQRKIAAILSAYDDLIENNMRRIAILEEMARMLYREWFVHFRFPGHQHVRMVDSALGMVPEGWEVVKLGNVAVVNAHSIKKGKEPEEILYVSISSVSTGRIDEMQHLAFKDAPGRARRIVRHGDIIWSTVRPNRKSFSVIFDPPSSLVVSTGFAVITATKAPFTYLYRVLTTEDFVVYLTKRATGSAYPAVLAKDFEEAEILLPCEAVANSFHSVTNELLNQQHILEKENANLRKTRDLLLPRLVSGEVSV